jgi:hypothetical protein
MRTTGKLAACNPDRAHHVGYIGGSLAGTPFAFPVHYRAARNPLLTCEKFPVLRELSTAGVSPPCRILDPAAETLLTMAG